MSYLPGTHLQRKNFVEPPEGENDVDISVYNEIEIIGRSPVSRQIKEAEWGGQQGEAICIKPLKEFGAVIEVPQGQLERDYDATFIPDNTIPAEVVVRRVTDFGPSPEEIFAAAEADAS